MILHQILTCLRLFGLVARLVWPGPILFQLGSGPPPGPSPRISGVGFQMESIYRKCANGPYMLIALLRRIGG